MKKQFLKSAVGLALLAATQVASANVVLPTTGWAGDFVWTGGLGQINAINDNYSDTGWDITVATDSVVAVSAVQDAFIPGDSFELTLDGVVQTWDSAGFTFGVQNFFQAVLNNLFLSVGSHTISLNVISLADCGGYACDSGRAYAQFGRVTPAPVPLPAAALLFGSALLGAGALGRKRKEEQAGALAVA